MSNNTFLGVFAKSPLKPIEEHINAVHACSELLKPFFDAVFQNDWDKAAKVQAEIGKLENHADDIKRDLRINLPAGIFMPVARQDVLELLTQQDKIANRAKDISGRVLGRQLTIPEPMKAEFTAYLNRCLDATHQARIVINELDELLETGFRGREVRLVEDMIEKLDCIEDDTDTMQVKLRRHLQELEGALNPIDVMFLYSIIEWVGDLADHSERVGSRLELMLAK